MRASKLAVPALAAAMTVLASPASAACPMELAVYASPGEVATIDFRPTGESAAVTNTFRFHMREGVSFDGIVLWTEEPRRAHGMLMHECPEGDVTGEEIAACTVWEGVVYAVDEAGAVGQLPAEGEPAPRRLILADLARVMQGSPAYAKAGLTTLPDDVFDLSGCQE